MTEIEEDDETPSTSQEYPNNNRTLRSNGSSRGTFSKVPTLSHGSKGNSTSHSGTSKGFACKGNAYPRSQSQAAKTRGVI